MAVRVGINGFGRIGRNAFRAAMSREDAGQIEWVAVNDLTDAQTLGHLLKYDSILGPYPGTVEVRENAIVVDGKELKVLAERDPAALPWGELGVDVVVESTGFFTDRDSAAKHLASGAKKVVISAPAGDPDATVVLGVNFDEAYDREAHQVISNASCTTNCLAPMAKVLQRHGRHPPRPDDHDPRLHRRPAPAGHAPQGPAPGPRRRRINLIPASTGAAKAIGLVIPELQGRLNGFAVRAPVPTGSVVDLTIESARETTVEEINAALEAAAASGPLHGILQYTEDPIVSSDIVQSPYSSIVDSKLTAVMEQTMVKVVAWYDNEWGYSNRLVDLVQRVL